MAGELIGLAIQLAICAAMGVVLLRFVPRNASRSWGTGLLVFTVLANLGPVIGVVVAHFSPPHFYLDTEKNQLEFHRDRAGEVVGVLVNNPPAECLTYLRLGERTWALAVANITLAVVALAFWRRTSTQASPTTLEKTNPRAAG
jgi:hypothetical protein